jgi:hypothetical protein
MPQTHKNMKPSEKRRQREKITRLRAQIKTFETEQIGKSQFNQEFLQKKIDKAKAELISLTPNRTA